MISREKEIQEKQQGTITNDGKSSKTSSSTSRQWSAFKDPRIVRVSRHFGGKDRHSKVCTIRGLRDRRIRLSVPTAIQIYDLQFKLGLSQPSKVIDWLLEASKDDIDMLPPLPTIPLGITQFHGQMHVNAAAFLGHVSQSSLVPFLDVNDGRSSTSSTRARSWLPDNETHVKINYNNVGEYDHDTMMSRSAREQQKQAATNHDVKGKWIAAFSDDSQVGCGSFSGQGSSAQNFFPMSQSSWPGLLSNGAANMSDNSNSQWEPSNLTLSPFNSTSHHLRYQSSLGISSSSSGFQPFLCPPIVAQPLLHNPSYITNPLESSTTQLDHFQLLNVSSSQNLPFSLNVNASLMTPSQYSNESHPNKNNTNDHS